jgi:hypothetical protein
MGRPRLAKEDRKTVIRPVLSLHPILDEDIIVWWKSLPPGGRARAMVDRLRNGASDEEGKVSGGDQVEASEEMMDMMGSLMDEGEEDGA